jgi:hypothetical protein
MIDALAPPTLPQGMATDPLRRHAAELEAVIFAQVLRSAAPSGKTPLGGRESPFDDLLRQEQARILAASGGTGLGTAIAASIRSRLSG